jgi:aryl-alcohol dehydrogenase
MPQSDPLEIYAAVVRTKGGPFRVERLTLEEPRGDEVLVRMVASGMCHTDIIARDQLYNVPHPIVLGHEGAGVVSALVAKSAPSQPVITSCCRISPTVAVRLAWRVSPTTV